MGGGCYRSAQFYPAFSGEGKIEKHYAMIGMELRKLYIFYPMDMVFSLALKAHPLWCSLILRCMNSLLKSTFDIINKAGYY